LPFCPLTDIDAHSASSTASLTSSIFEYRNIQGRTFHSDRHKAEYFTPNDTQQLESVDITHHYLMILLDNKLHLAPLEKTPERVLDIGTGSGIWSIDFADQHPETEVIGTDLSPVQPSFVPPNLTFEIDDCTERWTWAENSFDFVHIRYLFGAIKDWTELFSQAYRVTKPGGWIQSCEAEPLIHSDDGTVLPDSCFATLWADLYTEGGAKMGSTFRVLTEGLQRKGLEEAGFVDLQEANFKLPIGGWPRDPKLAEVGRFARMTLENDVEGYTLFLWNQLLGWPQDQYQNFLMMFRKELRTKGIHGYMTIRYIWARKPSA
jgi:SAM-dependent methyltransferase